MPEWRSALQAERHVQGFAARMVAVLLAAAPAVAEVPLVAERNCSQPAQAAQLQMTLNKKIGAAHISLSSKSVIPRL
jgi:hypothetical protein